MEKELDPSIIKTTQTSLGKYVKRPPLSEKLLKKPPFRFLHDIITTVLKTTGFFEGLFDQDELVSDNVKDRESKILFLSKVISVVGLSTGKTLSAKPSKIVAGQEPDKTNELLQFLAQALDKKLSSEEAVQKFKDGIKPSQISNAKEKEPVKVIKKSTDTKKLTSKSSEKLTSQKKDQKDGPVAKNDNKEKDSKSKDGEANTLKQESLPKTSTQKSKKRLISQVESANQPLTSNLHANKESSKKTVKNRESSFVKNDDEKDTGFAQKQRIKNIPITEAIITDYDAPGKLDSSYTIADNDLNSSSSQNLVEPSKNITEHPPQESISTPLGDITSAIEDKDNKEKSRNNHESDIENKEHMQEETNTGKSHTHASTQQEIITQDTEIKEQDRITSAKKNETISNIVRPTSVRPSSSRPGAPRFRDKHGATEQGSENLLMGKVNIIVENAPNEEEEDPSIIIVEQQPNHNTSIEQPEQLASNQHGHLVQQILDSQKEFSQVNGKTEIEWQFGAQKAREAANQEIEQLRFNIQALSRVANPLGKLLDHIQEDVEVMRQELQQWTQTYEETSKELVKQKAANDDSLLPLNTKIKQLDADIKEKQDKIDDLKIVIHKNSSRIEKLLANGVLQ